jgi:hypothetical protein
MAGWELMLGIFLASSMSIIALERLLSVARAPLRAARLILASRRHARARQRLAATHALRSHARALTDAAVVRVRGTVEGGAATPGRPIARADCIRGDFGGIIDAAIEATDFVLRLADGERVRVRAGDAARAHQLRVLHDRMALAAGDEVEVVGLATRELDPALPSRGPREAPLGWVLLAPPRGVLALL